MLKNLEVLHAPDWLILIVIGLVVIVEAVGLISKLWGVIAPKLFKISTSNSRKKEIEKIILSNQEDIKQLKEKHNKDMAASEKTDNCLKEEINKTNEKLDKISNLVLDIRIDNMRKTLLDFASTVGAGRKCTKEQFDEIFSTYEDYEAILEQHNMTNGRVNISMEIVRDQYKYNLRHGGFLEDEIKDRN